MRPREFVLSTGFVFSEHMLFSALSTLTGTRGQSTYTCSNASLESNYKWLRHVSAHIAASSLLWGAVGYIGMRWKSFASDDFLGRSAPQHSCHALRFAFGNTDAKFVCGAKEVPTPFTCDVITPIQ